MSDDRAIVFARIKEALQTPAKLSHPSSAHSQPSSAPSGYAAWLPAVTDTPEGRLAAFRERSELLKTEFITTSSAQLPAVMADLKARHGWQSAAWHTDPHVDPARHALDLPGFSTDGHYDAAALEKTDVSLTACDCLVAQTGGVLATSASAGGRTLSILPPHHVVIASADQLLPDLPAAFRLIEKKYGDHLPSMMCFETGPSRTGDIERILVLGAHGPKKLTVVLVLGQ
ncbi:MAG: LUD domain-containing protein [Candidatus Methylacidiphilales bacterium]|nr:LUD domain-containing protein [Candidatus Methylacidiphilales bacterium]